MEILELSNIGSVAPTSQAISSQSKAIWSERSEMGNGNSLAEATAVREEDILNAIGKAEEMARVFDRSLNFRYLKDADRYQVEVVDEASGEVIRKIPPDEIVGFIEHVNELIGSLFDKQL